MEKLKAKKRKKKGKKTKELRKESRVPAVFYGPEVENQNLILDLNDFLRVFREVGESSIIGLEVEGEDNDYKVLVKDFQMHPLTDKVIHVDLYQPILTEKIEANVPLVFKGEAPAVKEKEGVLIKNIDEVVVSALPMDLPSEIGVDISILKGLNDTIRVKDLKVSEDAEILRNPGDIVASVSAPKTAEELMEEMERKEEEELFVGEEVPLEEEGVEEAGEEAEAEETEEEQKEIEL